MQQFSLGQEEYYVDSWLQAERRPTWRRRQFWLTKFRALPVFLRKLTPNRRTERPVTALPALSRTGMDFTMYFSSVVPRDLQKPRASLNSTEEAGSGVHTYNPDSFGDNARGSWGQSALRRKNTAKTKQQTKIKNPTSTLNPTHVLKVQNSTAGHLLPTCEAVCLTCSTVKTSQ